MLSSIPVGLEVVLLLSLPPIKGRLLRRFGEHGQDAVVAVTKLQISNGERECMKYCKPSMRNSVGDSNAHQVGPVAVVQASEGDWGGHRGVGGCQRLGRAGRVYGGCGKGMAFGV